MTQKKKRVLNRVFVAGLAAVLLIAISLYKVPHFINVSRLEELGYSEEAIDAIYQKKIRREILRNDYYSDYLNQEVVKENFNKKYIFLYAVADSLNETSFALYDRLLEIKGYSKEELIKLYDQLELFELTPLLVFDKLDNIDAYISDCNAHPENNETTLHLDGDYLKPYNDVKEVLNRDSIETYVSPKFSIGDYTPQKLVTIPERFASSNLMLESKGLDAFQKLCDALEREELGIYAVSAYRSFEDQKRLYDSYSSEKEADINVTRPGFYDAQTGLSVSIVSVENESLNNFKETDAYQWILENASKYGFIIRYPEEKESITGQKGMPYYLRYVGEDLAKKVDASGLTFDEYYMFYMYEKSEGK